jgi:hypothetical protein
MNAGFTIHRYRLLAGSLLVIAPLLAFARTPGHWRANQAYPNLYRYGP